MKLEIYLKDLMFIICREANNTLSYIVDIVGYSFLWGVDSY